MTPLRIDAIDVYRVKIPLRTPYHLSKVYGTLTHSDVLLARIRCGDVHGWGEADPGGIAFTGDTTATALEAMQQGLADELIGSDLEHWLEDGPTVAGQASAMAAVDVAVHDARARHLDVPVWHLLGGKVRDGVEVLWPTSSGTAEEDLEVIAKRHPQGFRTYMLKMGSRPAREEIPRVEQVLAAMPAGVRIMVDANQGWERDEAIAFARMASDLPLVLIEQPVAATDLEGLRMVRESTGVPVSVDESLQRPEDARAVIDAGAADVFSIKISKNGGLRASAGIARLAGENGIGLLMNSMIELGVTQSASLHLAAGLEHLVDCGHAYMSTLRMADDVTDFSDWVTDGVARLPERPGLGVTVDMDRIRTYLEGEHHAGTG